MLWFEGGEKEAKTKDVKKTPNLCLRDRFHISVKGLFGFTAVQLFNYKEHIWIIYQWNSLFSSNNLNNNNTQNKFVYAGGWVLVCGKALLVLLKN